MPELKTAQPQAEDVRLDRSPETSAADASFGFDPSGTGIAALDVRRMLALQRTAGNAAVTGLVTAQRETAVRPAPMRQAPARHAGAGQARTSRMPMRQASVREAPIPWPPQATTLDSGTGTVQRDADRAEAIGSQAGVGTEPDAERLTGAAPG